PALKRRGHRHRRRLPVYDGSQLLVRAFTGQLHARIDAHEDAPGPGRRLREGRRGAGKRKDDDDPSRERHGCRHGRTTRDVLNVTLRLASSVAWKVACMLPEVAGATFTQSTAHASRCARMRLLPGPHWLNAVENVAAVRASEFSNVPLPS